MFVKFIKIYFSSYFQTKIFSRAISVISRATELNMPLQGKRIKVSFVWYKIGHRKRVPVHEKGLSLEEASN